MKKRRRSVDQTLENQRILDLVEVKKAQLRMQRDIKNVQKETVALDNAILQSSPSTSIVPYNPNPLGKSPSLALQNFEGAVFITED